MTADANISACACEMCCYDDYVGAWRAAQRRRWAMIVGDPQYEPRDFGLPQSGEYEPAPIHQDGQLR